MNIGALLACAGVVMGAPAQVLVPQGNPAPNQPANQPANLPVNQPANPAPSVRVFVDESINAADVVLRARELGDAGNLTEAARVLQDLLDTDAGKLVRSEGDASLYLPVRSAVHTMLLSWPELLRTYRAEQEPAAQQMIAQGEVERAFQTRFLTQGGLEASLRFAQAQIESARFESARLVLEELPRHPDASTHAQDCALVAETLCKYLPRAAVRELAKALGDAAPQGASFLPPPLASMHAASPLDSFGAPSWADLSPQPLQSVAFSPAPTSDDRALPYQRAVEEATSWIFPSVSDDALYVSDDQAISAFDAATLALRWRVEPSSLTPTPADRIATSYFIPNSRAMEDIAQPAVAQGIVVAATGQPVNGVRMGDQRLHALRASDGSLLWSITPRWVDERLGDGYVRGPAVIEGDTVVVGVRKPGYLRRMVALYLAGFDLTTGSLRWTTLVGSSGAQAWSRAQARADACALREGVVYRADDMGVLGAFDASTGRTLWVRVMGGAQLIDPNQGLLAQDSGAAFEVHQPVVTPTSLFCLEPGSGSLLQLDPRTGIVQTRRNGAELDTPTYLVRTGEFLACVSRTSACFVPLAQVSGPVVRPAMKALGKMEVHHGRAVALGGTLAIPVESGVLVVDPARGGEATLHALPRTGNLVMPGSADGSGGHAVVADTEGVHTFLSWDKARTTLEARVQKDPESPTPLLTYMQLALRQGKADLVPALADRALDVLARPALPAQTGARAKAEMFALLHEVSERSRDALLGQEPRKAASSFALPPVKEPALLDQLLARQSRASTEPKERLLTLLDTSFLREYQQQPAGAVESLQRILSEDALARVDMSGEEEARSAGARTAMELATSRVRALIEQHGAGAYTAFDDEAARALEAVPSSAPAETLVRLARQYPAAGVTPEAWRRAAIIALKENDRSLLRTSLAEGLHAASIAARSGRTTPEVTLAGLAGTLLENTKGAADLEPALLLVSALEKSSPATTVRVEGRDMPLHDAANVLHERIAARSGLPTVGTNPGGQAQALEGWQPAVPLASGEAGESTSMAPMISRDGTRVALFAPSLGDGRMTKLWERAVDVQPTFVRVSPSMAVLYHPATSKSTLEAIAPDGTTLWTTQPVQQWLGLREARAGERPARINTPLEGLVRADDILYAMDEETLYLGQRDGVVGALRMRDGTALWARTLPFDRLYDLDAKDGLVCAIGAGTVEGSKGLIAGCLGMSTAHGETAWTVESKSLDDHARWVRVLRGGGAVVGTSDAVIRIAPSAGAISWRTENKDLRATGAGWVVGDGLFVLDDNFALRHLKLASGDGGTEAIDDMGRLRLPFEVTPTKQSLTLSSEQGLAVFDSEGEIIGLDSIDSGGQLTPPVLCEGKLVSVQTFPREAGAFGGAFGSDPRAATVPARLLIFSHPDGRLIGERRLTLYERPDTVRVVDGAVLIDQGVFTNVVSLRSDE